MPQEAEEGNKAWRAVGTACSVPAVTRALAVSMPNPQGTRIQANAEGAKA